MQTRRLSMVKIKQESVFKIGYVRLGFRIETFDTDSIDDKNDEFNKDLKYKCFVLQSTEKTSIKLSSKKVVSYVFHNHCFYSEIDLINCFTRCVLIRF